MFVFNRTFLKLTGVILLFGNLPCNAQSGILNGRMTDKNIGMGVISSLVLDYSTHQSIYSDNKGNFSLAVNRGDTVVLSAVGYYYQRVVVTDSMLGAPVPVKFVFTPRAYEISEARILGLGTYDDFRQRFVELQRPKSKTEILSENLAKIASTEGREAYDRALATGRLKGSGAGIPILTPEEKERIMLAKIVEKEKIKEQVYQKFNPDFVKKVTGLTADSDILEFMVFCNFSDEYLLDITPGDLLTQIIIKFGIYKKKKISEHPEGYRGDAYEA